MTNEQIIAELKSLLKSQRRGFQSIEIDAPFILVNCKTKKQALNIKIDFARTRAFSSLKITDCAKYVKGKRVEFFRLNACLLYTSPSPRD